MRSKVYRLDSLKAWVAISLVALAPGFLVAMLVLRGYEAWLLYVQFGLVHGAFLLAIGLPFLMVFWPRPTSVFWRPLFTLTLGFILGYICFSVTVLCFTIFTESDFNRIFWLVSVLGGLCGSLTGAAASFVNHRRMGQM